MRRKITKNKHQYKISLPIQLLRKMGWDGDTSVVFKEVETPEGRGLVMIKSKDEIMRLELK